MCSNISADQCSKPFVRTPPHFCCFSRDCRLIPREPRTRWAAADRKASHMSFKLVVWQKNKGFHESHDFISQSIKTNADSQGNSVWFCTLFQQSWTFWCGVSQIHILITSLTINPCCTHICVKCFHCFGPFLNCLFFINVAGAFEHVFPRKGRDMFLEKKTGWKGCLRSNNNVPHYQKNGDLKSTTGLFCREPLDGQLFVC